MRIRDALRQPATLQSCIALVAGLGIGIGYMLVLTYLSSRFFTCTLIGG